MLFDLKGKRRRTVQITYAGLAVLIGIGLVGGGIGSGVSGGFFDIFGGGNGGSSSNAPIEKKIKREERLLRVNPHNQAALAAIVRYRYEIAAAQSDQRTGRFSKDGKKSLAAVSTAFPLLQTASFVVPPPMSMLSTSGVSGDRETATAPEPCAASSASR